MLSVKLSKKKAIKYFFDRIRKQILTALANRKMCEDLHLMGKLALFEKDMRETVGKDWGAQQELNRTE